ncbi:RNA polymerase Rpb7 [Polychytrium aggregatum]|uniref:RNA polymerase Rpb7 n=1 Tax=Polychytrium aggregatum TaxID=110093 RepID=UPI0022FEB215|nr:RNA polymerase Rpb7 [Polychytrium aggregatum]KAI9204652.1 RNA polymerase Rpb7 [Polychytrium aggregatum]
MGFFVKVLHHTIQLHPQHFGPHMRQFLTRRLYEEVEGTCTGRYGYIISVIDVHDYGKGVLQASSGYAEFDITYKAIVFKPFKNQVFDGIVTTVNKMGFFADVGPLQVFVSNHLIPSYLKFDPTSNPPAYIGEGQDAQDLRIEKGEGVRMRIVGIRTDAADIFAIGTIKEDFLGPTPEV